MTFFIMILGGKWGYVSPVPSFTSKATHTLTLFGNNFALKGFRFMVFGVESFSYFWVVFSGFTYVVCGLFSGVLAKIVLRFSCEFPPCNFPELWIPDTLF